MILPSDEQLVDAIDRMENGTENPGFCTACGAEREGCEPDARDYECWDWGEHKVQGLLELVM